MIIFDESINHHLQRAEYWREKGELKFARGSERKAARWCQKKREVDYLFKGPYPKDRLGTLIGEKIYAVEVALKRDFESVMYGEVK